MTMDVDRLIASLVEARDYYQNMLKHASSQLEHIQGLLEGFGAGDSLPSLPNITSRQIFPLDNTLLQSQMNGSPVKASTTTDLQTEATQTEEEPQAVNSTTAIAVSSNRNEDIASSDFESDDVDDADSTNGLVNPNSTATNSTVAQKSSPTGASNGVKRSLSNSRKRRPPRQIPPLSIPFLPKMSGMKLGDAILSVLQEHPNDVSNTDYIVRAIYGELEGIVLRTAKDRVIKELSRGYKQGRWYRLADTPGWYTASKKLAQSRS
ncbi:MAG: hypothetical protein VKL59_21680 [Nostocaceae cyanobacterium]|nr:hypothetical protein [Nostocaceae cyanobacterium]